MNRYIEADAVVWEIEKDKCGLEDYDSALDVAIAEIKTFKTANVVEVVHGVWLEDSDGNLICSKCKFKFYPIMFKFCPNCGADMRLKGGTE